MAEIIDLRELFENLQGQDVDEAQLRGVDNVVEGEEEHHWSLSTYDAMCAANIGNNEGRVPIEIEVESHVEADHLITEAKVCDEHWTNIVPGSVSQEDQAVETNEHLPGLFNVPLNRVTIPPNMFLFENPEVWPLVIYLISGALKTNVSDLFWTFIFFVNCRARHHHHRDPSYRRQRPYYPPDHFRVQLCQ
jgi:hypothetical protein